MQRIKKYINSIYVWLKQRPAHYKSAAWREVLWAACPAIVFFGIYAILPLFGYVYVWTGSLPIGLWRYNSEGLNSPYISFCLPSGVYSRFFRDHVLSETDTLTYSCSDNTPYLVKPIMAKPGDTVELTTATVKVNGIPLPNTATLKKSKVKKVQIPHIPRGRYVVAPGTLWVISTYNNASFDSRYYGGVREQWVKSGIDPVLVYTDNSNYRIQTRGSVYCLWRWCWVSQAISHYQTGR